MALEEAGVQLVAQGAGAYDADLKSATNATNTFVDATEKGGGRVSGAGQVMIGALRKVGEVAITALADAAKATVAFVGDSISLAGDFDQKMSVLQETSGATAEEMKMLSAKAKELGSDLTLPATSAVNAGDAMLELAKAGFTATEQMDAAKGVLQLAAAAQIDEAKAAEINANALQAFGLEAKQSMFVSDLLAASANASSIDATDMADTYKMAGAIFSAFQGPVVGSKEALIDLTTAASLLGNAGIKGSDAGTSLKQSLLQLTAPSDKAKGLMKALAEDIGVAGDIAYDAAGNMRSFPEILGLVSESTRSLSEEQRNYIISTIFGADAARAILILMQQGPDAWDKMSDAVTRQGAAQDLAAAQTKGFNGAIEGAKSQVETLQLTIGQALTPILSELLNNYISPGIASITTFADAILSADNPLQALITSINDVLPGFRSFVDTAKTVGAFIGDNLKPILFGLATAITVAVVPALVTATGAFLAAAAPIVALVAAGALLYKAWETDFLGIKTTLIAVWDNTLYPAFQQMQAWLAEKIPPAIKTLSDFWTNTLQSALKEVWTFLQNKVFPVLSDLADVYIAAAIIEVKTLAALWSNDLQPALKVVWDFISRSVIPIFKALFEVNWAIAMKAGEALAGLWQKVIQPALKTVGDYISATVIPVFKTIGDYLDQTFGPILTSVGKWLDDVTGGFTGVSNAVQGAITWLSDLATSISNLKLPDWLTPGSPTPLETGLIGIGKALQTTIAPGLDLMQSGLRDIGAAFGETDLINQLTALGEDAMAGFGIGIKDGVRNVIRIVNSTADNVKNAFDNAFGAHSPATTMIPTGQSVTQGLMVGIEAMIPALNTLIDSIATSMIAALKKNRQEMSDQIRDAANDLIEQARSLAEDINQAIADGFSATASIDRQLAKNLGKLTDVLPDFQQYAQGALLAAEQQARMILDPTEGAKYFKMRSDQILEYEQLRKQLYEAETKDDRDRIRRQMELINAAQIAEISAVQQGQQGQQSPTQAIIAAFQQLLAGNETIEIPGILDNPIIRQLSNLINQLQQPPANQWANPPASARQMSTQPANANYNNQRTYNMPIYTNQSPQVLQQSWAVMQASMT